jgi:hypothetical protein
MLSASKAFTGRTITSSRSLVAFTPKRALVVQNAHKKGAGSTKNGRDSESKRRGVKSYGGQPIKAGGIIVRQLGSTVSRGQLAACGNGVAGPVRTTARRRCMQRRRQLPMRRAGRASAPITLAEPYA